ncbi:MAG: HAMP domain-containing protein [Armatimonadetes bacterium]|nr:HAMP domain-containing protein [Armatimonadota bacterium]
MVKLPIRWMLVACYAGLFALTLTVLGAGVRWEVHRYLWRDGETRLLAQAHGGGRPMRRGSRPPDRPLIMRVPALQERAQRFAMRLSSGSVAVRVLNPLGGQIASAGPEDGPPLDTAQVDALLKAGHRSHRTWLESAGDDRWQVVLVPIERDGQLLGFAQLASSWNQADDLLNALNGILVFGGLVAVGFVIVASILLSRLLASPLERLADVAGRVARGDLGARTGLGGGTNEIHDVARAFDEMAGRVQASFEAQRRFVADASHELKTPLTAIGGMAELLRSGAADSKRAVATIEREVDRMGGLVGDLLTLSGAEAPEANQARAPVDVASLVREVAGELQVGDHRLEVDSPGPMMVLGDTDALHRAVRNLADNALKYTPAGGTIRLRCRREGADVVVRVEDTGIGIPAADLPRVFDRFYRSDPSRTRGTGGSGLGLAIVRAIVKSHGGQVRLDSVEGQGSAVTITLKSL